DRQRARGLDDTPDPGEVDGEPRGNESEPPSTPGAQPPHPLYQRQQQEGQQDYQSMQRRVAHLLCIRVALDPVSLVPCGRDLIKFPWLRHSSSHIPASSPHAFRAPALLRYSTARRGAVYSSGLESSNW